MKPEQQRRRQPIPRPLNALSIDVEDYFQVAALATAIPRERWDTCEYRVERNTDRLLDLLSRRGMRATFFVLGWIAERSPRLVQRIAALGHEIASHGLSHQLVYQQPPDQFREETTRAKRCLEDLVGSDVLGYRAASFSITRESRWALDILIDLGFKYDSSVFPIHHDRYGMPDASPEPGIIVSPSGRTLAEFPMSTVSLLGLRLPVSGGGYFRILPYWVSRAGLRRINEHARRPFVFYLHPWEIDPGQPRVQVDWFSQFRHYTNLERCEERFERVLGDFSFGSMREVLQLSGLLSATPEGGLQPPGLCRNVSGS